MNDTVSLLPPVYSGEEIDDLLQRISRFGQIDIEEFRSLLNFHRAVLDLAQFCRRYSAEAPSLAQMFASIDRLEKWNSKQAQLLNPHGEIRDDATEDLFALRELARELHEKIQKRLEDYLHKSNLRDYLQDNYVTLRDGRYVLPIKSNFKGKVPGIIHDVSNSEATLFVEPQDVVEWNNQLKVTEREIQAEVEKVLAEVVSDTQPHVGVFAKHIDFLAVADLISAFVMFAREARASLCLPEDADEIVFESLVHPLLALEQGVVSNSLSWQKAFVLTGPNTGGKTVLLKALGLNVCLSRAGFPVFAQAATFPKKIQSIFVSIGDEQSLKEHLSTFSAHLKSLGEMYEKAQEGDLLLIDEIATGTAPEEGQPLAQAFIEKAIEKKLRLFVTTHYGALKQFALVNPDCRIASMAFNPQTQKPTYKLVLDIPGESSAFETAAAVGFSDDILQRARFLKGEEAPELAQALESLKQAQLKMEKREEELREQLGRAQKREEQAQKAVESYALKQKVLLNDEADALIKDFKKLRAELENKIKSSTAEDIKKSSENISSQLSDANTRLRVELAEHESLRIHEKRAVELGQLRISDIVEISGLGVGEVLEIPKSQDPKEMLLVQVGDLKTRVSLDRLKKVQAQRQKSYRANRRSQEVQKTRAKPAAGPGSSSIMVCDVRGKSVEEAMRRLEFYLNQLLGDESAKLTVIHGHGTSRLKDSIRMYLEKNRPDVTFRPGSWPGEGGDGVTLVELA